MTSRCRRYNVDTLDLDAHGPGVAAGPTGDEARPDFEIYWAVVEASMQTICQRHLYLA